jgi:hypothetical protein
LYFKDNGGVLDLTDSVVRTLCVHCEGWGLDALVKSSEGYREKSRFTSGAPSHEDLPSRFRILLNGGPYEVEDALRKMMGGEQHTSSEEALVPPEEAIANLKFLFVVLPLRSPAKYGLDSTHGLQLVARIFTTTADIFASTVGPGAEKWKALWMECFVDMILSLVDDEDLLKGMLTGVPNRASIEALGSTELMSIILTYKYLGGPIILFWLEFFAFIVLFGNIVVLVSSTVPELGFVILGILLITYFTLREFNLMSSNRRAEIDRRHQKMNEAKASDEIVQNAALTRSLTSSTGTSFDMPEESKEEKDAVHVDEDDEETNKVFAKRFDGSRKNQFLNDWLFLSYAWRSNVFNWISVAAWISGWIVLIDLLQVSISLLSEGDEFQYSSSETNLHVASICFFCLKFLGFLKGQ